MLENEGIQQNNKKKTAGELKKVLPSRRFPYCESEKDKKRMYRLRATWGRTGDRAARTRLDTYKKDMREKRMEILGDDHVVDGKRFTPQMMMDYICAQVASGMSLPEVCDREGMPSIKKTYSWFDNFPSFKMEYQRAEEVRGHILGEEALHIGRTTDRENVTADKLRVEVLSKAAARANQRFQDKAVVENRDEYQGMTEEQIRARIAHMLQANPELASVLAGQNLSVQEISGLHLEPSPPTLDCESLQIHESDDTEPTHITDQE